jgi:hypothetical protein
MTTEALGRAAAAGYQLSAISHQPSAISYQPSTRSDDEAADS